MRLDGFSWWVGVWTVFEGWEGKGVEGKAYY